MSEEPVLPFEDQERVSRLSSDSTGDEVVREYEQRYYGKNARMSNSATANGFDFDDEPARPAPRQREMPRSYSTLRLSDDEKLWAAVAHGSVWITLLGGFISSGTVVPLSVFIPLIIYFLFRNKSDYVSFHALQAFVLTLIGTVGAFLLLTIGGIVWSIGMVIALLAMVLLVGFILVPFWALVGVGLLAVVVLLPLAMLFLGTFAAIETYNGRDYRYPFIARWVDRQIAGGFLHTA